MIIFFNQLLLSETIIGGEFNNASARAFVVLVPV